VAEVDALIMTRESIMADFFATTSYNRTARDWRDVPETAADADDAPVAFGKRAPLPGKVFTVPRERLQGRLYRKELERIMLEFFAEMRAVLINSVVSACQRVIKTDPDKLSLVDQAMGLIDFSVLANLPKKMQKTLEKTYADAGAHAIKISSAGVGVSVHPRAGAFEQVHEDALDYAKFRSAEMVGMTYNDAGDLVPNLRVEAETGKVWAISETTREGIRSDVEAVVSGELQITELADTLRASYGFSDTRARLIARTEYNTANGAGALAGFVANGIKRKIWVTSHDDAVSEECAANEEQGPIPVDDEFQSGDDTDPAHPNCRCNVSAYVKIGDDGEIEE
jgi:SPP1 gp7 family putative phage head morphogenesis protein